MIIMKSLIDIITKLAFGYKKFVKHMLLTNFDILGCLEATELRFQRPILRFLAKLDFSIELCANIIV